MVRRLAPLFIGLALFLVAEGQSVKKKEAGGTGLTDCNNCTIGYGTVWTYPGGMESRPLPKDPAIPGVSVQTVQKLVLRLSEYEQYEFVTSEGTSITLDRARLIELLTVKNLTGETKPGQDCKVGDPCSFMVGPSTDNAIAVYNGTTDFNNGTAGPIIIRTPMNRDPNSITIPILTPSH